MRTDTFWNRVEVIPFHPCWEWIGCKNEAGYGLYRKQRAHIVSYLRTGKHIPEGLQLDHLCRNRGCVNPFHLEPVTLVQNVMRGVGPTAVNATKTHCLNGHEFTEKNTRLYKSKHTKGQTWRACRQCAREYVKRKYWERSS